MTRHTVFGFTLAAATAFTLACAQSPAPPTSPAGTSPAGTEAGPDGSTLKVTAPTLVSPIGGGEIDDNDPDLVINNAAPLFVDNLPLSYVFEVLDEGVVVYRSTPVPAGANGRTTVETAVLNYEENYTWRAYAVYQGQRGPMSASGAFRVFSRFGVSCAHMGSEQAIVACRRAQYDFVDHDEKPDFLAKIAYDLNRAGFEHAPYGRLVKDIGNNCHGYSCDIICAGQGGGQRQWDVLEDEDVAQKPVWNRVGEGAVPRVCEPVLD